MSKVISGSWDEIPHSEKVVRWERAFKTLDDMSAHAVDHHFNMRVWGLKTECGTVGCAAGKCGFDPWFRRRNFTLDFVNTYHGETATFTNHGPIAFFGVEGYEDIFINDFDETPTGRERKPRMVHAAVKRAIRKYIAQLRKGV